MNDRLVYVVMAMATAPGYEDCEGIEYIYSSHKRAEEKAKEMNNKNCEYLRYEVETWAVHD